MGGTVIRAAVKVGAPGQHEDTMRGLGHYKVKGHHMGIRACGVRDILPAHQETLQHRAPPVGNTDGGGWPFSVTVPV